MKLRGENADLATSTLQHLFITSLVSKLSSIVLRLFPKSTLRSSLKTALCFEHVHTHNVLQKENISISKVFHNKEENMKEHYFE